MRIWASAKIWQLFRYGPVQLSFLLIPISALATPAPPHSPAKAAAFQPQIVARTTPPDARSDRPWTAGQEGALRGHVAEARRVLMELRAFVDEAAKAVKLGDRLKTRQEQNAGLRDTLANSQAANNAIESHLGPADIIVSTLTRTVVRNWLETVRLNHRSDDVEQSLDASEKSRLILESRRASLERRLVERRTELRTLQARKAALTVQLDQMRRRITESRAETHRLERQRRQILTIEGSLRRRVTTKLRAVLLENRVP